MKITTDFDGIDHLITVAGTEAEVESVKDLVQELLEEIAEGKRFVEGQVNEWSEP